MEMKVGHLCDSIAIAYNFFIFWTDLSEARKGLQISDITDDNSTFNDYSNSDELHIHHRSQNLIRITQI